MYNADTGQVDTANIPKSPVIWTDGEIDKVGVETYQREGVDYVVSLQIRQSCRLARTVLNSIGRFVKPGVTTDELDVAARDLIIQNNAYPSLLNFDGFPKCISTSVNNIAAHGVPDSRPLQTGDILNIDVTVYLDGYHGDVSDTFTVGQVDSFAERLIEVTRETLNVGIDNCGPGKPPNIPEPVLFICLDF